MAWTEPMVPVDAEPLKDGEQPNPDLGVNWQRIVEDLATALKGNRDLAAMYVGLFQSTQDKHTALSYPCKKCGQQQFFKLPMPDLKARMQAMEGLLNRLVGKPADTVRHEGSIDVKKSLSEMTEDELERLAAAALPR